MKKIAIFWLILFSFFQISLFPALAQSPLDFKNQEGFGSGEIPTTFGQGEKPADVRIIVAKIIKVIFTLIGMIAICYFIYAGYLWMTAGGDEGKIDTAKNIIKAAIIGLIIIFVSWSITNFVFRSLLKVSGNIGIF